MFFLSAETFNNMNLSVTDILRFTRPCRTFSTSKRDFSVISCRLRGSTDFFIDDGKVHASPESFIYIPAQTSYYQKSSDEEIICVHFKTNAEFCEKITSFSSFSGELREKFTLLDNLWKKKNAYTILKCKSIIYDILFGFYRSSDEEAGLSSLRKMICPTLEYMEEHFYDADFSLRAAISTSNISETYFRRIFKSVYKIAPTEYINNLRVSRAKALLLGTDLSTSEISYMCGFSSEKYFYPVFKKITNTTPKVWKRENS